MTASTTAAENLAANKGSWRVSVEGNASGNGVINKSVNDVSGLMLVVTRSLGGLGRWHHSASYRRILPSPRRLNRFQPSRSFDSLLFDTNKRTTSCHVRRMFLFFATYSWWLFQVHLLYSAKSFYLGILQKEYYFLVDYIWIIILNFLFYIVIYTEIEKYNDLS